MIEFPGKEIYVPQFGPIWKPYATIKLMSEKSTFSCQMLVDSGADISLIPHNLGEELGFELETTEISEIRGVGDAVVPYVIKKIGMSIGKHTFEPRIGWALVEEVPLILGRLDVFDRFNVFIKQNQKKVIFEKVA